MHTHLSNNVIPLFDAHHDHHWQPIDGWRARYHCECGATGRKPDLVTHRFEWEPHRSVEITPYVCTKRVGGAPCGCLALKRNHRGRWRCREHLVRKPVINTNDALVVHLPTRMNDTRFPPLHQDAEPLVRRSSAEP